MTKGVHGDVRHGLPLTCLLRIERCWKSSSVRPIVLSIVTAILTKEAKACDRLELTEDDTPSRTLSATPRG